MRVPVRGNARMLRTVKKLKNRVQLKTRLLSIGHGWTCVKPVQV